MTPTTTLTDLRRDLAEIAVFVSYVLDLGVTVWAEGGGGVDRVVEADREVDERCRSMVTRIAGTHARWELPYAPHVRSLVAATVAAVAIERTGDLAVEVARRGQRAGAPPASGRQALEELLTSGHRVADALGASAAAMRDGDAVKCLEAAEAARAATHGQAVVREDVWQLPRADRTWAAQALLASRCLERAAANAAELAQRVIWAEYGSRPLAA